MGGRRFVGGTAVSKAYATAGTHANSRASAFTRAIARASRTKRERCRAPTWPMARRA